jgi:nucleotide-binding universal stress UspA family protein
MNIVVGIDGSEHGSAAVRWAAREARTLGAPLSLVHVYSVPAVPSVAGPIRTPEQRRYADQHAGAILERARLLAESELEGASVRLSTDLVEGSAGPTLVDLSHGAGMLVLGSHSGLFLHHRLGSVVGACLHAATCPVVVIPADVPATAPRAPAQSVQTS